jgi:hypothetical protein
MSQRKPIGLVTLVVLAGLSITAARRRRKSSASA